MNKFVIPWHEFLAALKKQNPTTRESWLRRWHFTDEGVLLDDVNIHTARNVRDISSRVVLH
jgi:hypothetical protein